MGGTGSSGRGHVLITGASTGIGRACALHLAKRGFTVIAGTRRESDGQSLVADSSGAIKSGRRWLPDHWLDALLGMTLKLKW